MTILSATPLPVTIVFQPFCKNIKLKKALHKSYLIKTKTREPGDKGIECFEREVYRKNLVSNARFVIFLSLTMQIME